MEAVFKPAGPHQTNLRNFTNELPEEVAFAIIALMYSGRNHEVDPVKCWKKLQVTIETKDKAVSILLEKNDPVTAIKKAVGRLSNSKALDDLPSKISGRQQS